MSSYGTCPAYWAMVRDDDYEDAKKLIGLSGNDEYRDFVALIDEYHYNVQQKAPEILKKLQNKGIQTGVLVKYGAESFPFVKDASFGATTAKVGEPFSDAYVAQAQAAGKGDLISPDHLIDGSTALFPETTWYVKYFPHTWWGTTVDQFILRYLQSNGTLRVGDENAMPRFQIYNDKTGAATEMTAENANSQSDYYKTDKLSSLFSFLAAFIPFLRRMIDLVKAKLGM